MSATIVIQLVSDASFGSGDGLPGVVDLEIEHDADGFPMIRGRTLKGLLREECANLRYALGPAWEQWAAAEQWLFGRSGATTQHHAAMQIGSAQLPPALRAELQRLIPTASERLAALTTIRRQTAVDAQRGAPETGSLRSMRVLLRQTYLLADVSFLTPPDPSRLALLSACVLALRRGGSGRNRGRGELCALLHTTSPADPFCSKDTEQHFAYFAQLMKNPQEASHAHA